MTIDVDAPSLEEVFEQIFDVQTSDLRVAIPANASNFDSSKKTVSVESWIIEEPDLPIIPSVPVCFPGLVWDIEDGQAGLLVAGDKRWIASWRAGSRQVPEDSGSHEYDYAIFIPGVRTKTDSEAFGLGSGDTICPQLSSGDLLLGDDTASEYLVLGTTFDTELDTFLDGLKAWIGVVRTQVLAAGGGDVDPGYPTGTFSSIVTAFKAATILSMDVKTK